MDTADLLTRIGPWQRGNSTVSRRLAQGIAAAIEDGRLPAGTRLPAERELAKALEVSRGTVVRSYARLREERLAHTTHGAGTTVGSPDQGVLQRTIRADGIVAAVGQRDHDTIDLRVAAWDGDDQLVEALRIDPREHARAIHRQDGYFPQGLGSLRESLAHRLTGLGLPTHADQLLITNGAQQAIDVVLSSITRPGDPVLLEETTWPGLVELLPVRHLRASTVPLVAHDHIGMLRALRERRADVAYLIPSFHNPTGAVTPAPVRRLVVEAAAASGAVVIEDMALAELWIDAPPPAPLAAIVPDAAAKVITIGSLSKSLWGGLRLGWIRAEGTLMRQLISTKTVCDLGAGVPAQLAAVHALEQADQIVARRRDELRERRERALGALEEHLPAWRVVPPPGGMSLWVDLDGADADRVARRAREHGVRVPSARVCSADGRALGHLRLTLARPPHELETAITRLAAASRDVPRSGLHGVATEIAGI